MIRKLVASVAGAALFAPTCLSAEPIGKTRGPFDNFRQFTSHFEFSVPRDQALVRECVVGEINKAASLQSQPAPSLKIKQSKRKGVAIERLSWKVKTSSGYTLENEVTLSSADGWTRVDTDYVYAETYEETAEVEPGRDGIVGLHTRCGLAADTPFPATMPLPLAWTDSADDVKLSASSPKGLRQMIQCLRMMSSDVGDAYMSTTFEADHTGAFYTYYIANYKNLGSTQRQYYALKILPTEAGTHLQLLAPGVSLGSDNPTDLRKENYAAQNMEKCGGSFDAA